MPNHAIRSELIMTRVLKPGGWVQMVECYYMCQSDNGSISDENALRQWSEHYLRAIEEKKDPRAPLQLQSMINAAGLVDVESRMMPMPLCGWANGELTLSFYYLRYACHSSCYQASFQCLGKARSYCIASYVYLLMPYP